MRKLKKILKKSKEIVDKAKRRREEPYMPKELESIDAEIRRAAKMQNKKINDIINTPKFGSRRRKPLTPSQKRDLQNTATLAVVAPPLVAGLGAFSKEVNDQKTLARDAVQKKKRLARKKVLDKERERKRLEEKKKREAAKKKKENKKTKPKKMKTGGIAIKGFGKAFLKGKK